MGTRHLIVVTSRNKVKVAQYGQFDGYPSGQGADILNFILSANLSEFKNKVDALSFYTEKEIDSLDPETNTEISRNTSSQLLNLIYDGKVRKVYNNEKFAADGLFCEYCYVLDLDTYKLEVYTGSKTDLTPEDRFYYLMDFVEKDSEYKPVRKVIEFDMKNPPKVSKFIEETETAIEKLYEINKV
jgi:hypothetical protein